MYLYSYAFFKALRREKYLIPTVPIEGIYAKEKDIHHIRLLDKYKSCFVLV